MHFCESCTSSSARCPAAGCLQSGNLALTGISIAMTIIFVLTSLCIGIADGADLNPRSCNFAASAQAPCMLQRAVIRNCLAVLPAITPNFIRVRVSQQPADAAQQL